MKIAIQGGHYSFHDLVARRWFGEAAEIVPCESFADVFAALQSETADKAVVAIENSLYGSINEVYDLLLKHQFPIIGEVPEHIHQQLITHPDTTLADIQVVYSHPVALNQCAQFLDTYLPQAERIEYFDTAESVAHIKALGDHQAAAIAGHGAAQAHGMAILSENIEDEATNFTRFLILDRDAEAVDGADKASLVLRTSHKPGALYEALGIFANRNINLTKLHSRPIRGKVWLYQFFIDCEADTDQLTESIEALRNADCEVTLLGHYRKATTGDID